MSQLKEKSESVSQTFVRGSKLRKPFRVRQSYNQKLPLSAVIYIKSLEQCTVVKCMWFDKDQAENIAGSARRS